VNSQDVLNGQINFLKIPATYFEIPATYFEIVGGYFRKSVFMSDHLLRQVASTGQDEIGS
jgi:hypothetical protein